MSHISHGEPQQVDKRTIATARGRGVVGWSPPRTIPQGPVGTISPGAPPSPLCDTRALTEEFPTPRALAALRDSPTVMYSPLTRDTGSPSATDTLPLRASPLGVIPSPRAGGPPGLSAPTEGVDPIETFIFSRRCSFPLKCIYFFVDRRGSQSPGPSETITSHSRYLLPQHSEGMSLREPLVSECQGDLRARARIHEDRGSSPRPVLIPWRWLLSEQLGFRNIADP